ncbi:MAG: cell division protein FtsQ [Sphingomonas bacterium]|uniref:cell division protein FtsQ/DivIB n=1 Tax=Sphingomonas bacterium TaxID=1895847 RepID=UPI00263631F9|nr:cell division protein FtsQ/DivIB [Sphingomonas bacterium]MDB5696791.1 cell division protein FtsQ [Sphingomonas bacterium]
MSRTIKRGTPPRKTLSRGPPRRRAKPKASRLDRLIAKLPVREETLRKVATRGILTLGGVAALTAAAYAGVPAMVGTAMGEAAGRAGFRLDEVQAPGLKQMDFMTVNAIVLEQQTRALPLVDLERIRERLLLYGWVKDAAVSRRYPNKILVRITERVPAAVWQHQGELTLIDAEGVLLEPVDRDAIPDLPLVIGPGADKQEAQYQKLLAAAPALKPRIVAATWIGNRRWDLRFDSGETLKLPEEGAGAALLDFAKRDGANPLLGRGWLSFDLRNPDKMVVRKPPGGVRQVADPGEPVTVAKVQGMEG